MDINVGENIIIQSYKHNKTLHRIWKNETIIENNEEHIVVANKRTKVVEANGRFWYTREPSVSFFFKDHWYNIIAIIKRKKITFYCNLASPILVDDEAIKYIDYDLDLRVDGDFSYKVVDIYEFKKHSKQMDYTDRLTNILAKETLHLRNRINQRDFPFNHDIIRKLYNKYIRIEEKKTEQS